MQYRTLPKMARENLTQEERDQAEEQMNLAELEARRSEMMHRNLDYGNVRGLGGIIIGIILVAAFFGLLYFLSLD